MSTKTHQWIAAAVAALVLTATGCSNEINRTASPVELLVTNTQKLQRFDIAPAATGCAVDIGQINIRAVLKNPSQVSNQTFNDVRITSYRVSYVRTDGGTQVPAAFTRNIDALIVTGGAVTPISKFLILETGALTQAPFAALLPTNGNRDPQTGLNVVKMNVIVEVFGETLAGEKVAGATQFPLDFCYQCNGCA